MKIDGSKIERPTAEQFRSAGMTEEAAAFPRSPRQLAMFAAFLGVEVDKLPPAARYFANASMQAMWQRAERACLEFEGDQDGDDLQSMQDIQAALYMLDYMASAPFDRYAPPDDKEIGYDEKTGEPCPMTFGHIRRARRAADRLTAKAWENRP